MAYDILEIEAKRQTAASAVFDLWKYLYDIGLSDSLSQELRSYLLAAHAAYQDLVHQPSCICPYCAAVICARKDQESLTGPADSCEPSPWSSPEMRSKRFILKACGLWSDEYQEPMVTDPRTWSQINLAADLIGKYLTNPKYGSALTPDLFHKYFASTTDSPLRPQYIPERFNDFLSWCRTKGFIS